MSTPEIYQANLNHAVRDGYALLAELLIAKKGTKDQKNRRKLLRSAICIADPKKIAAKSDIEIVKLLISNGADVNDPATIEGKKIYPILFAAQQCKVEIVQILIKNGAVEYLSILRAPLLTRKSGYLETLKTLLAAGADPNIADLRATPVLATALDLPLTDSPLKSPDCASKFDIGESQSAPLEVHSRPQHTADD